MAKAKVFKVVLEGVHRLSHAHISEPTSFEGSEPKYDTTFLIPKNHPDIQAIKDAINASYKDEKEGIFSNLPIKSPKVWIPLRDGDEILEEKPERTEYEGMMFIKATSKVQPTVYNTDKKKIYDLDEQVYSGCFCRGVIVITAFNKNGKKGFSCYLNSLMKIKDGDRLGGVNATADDYGDVSTSETDVDYDDEI